MGFLHEAKCICCERGFTYIGTEADERVYCSICDDQPKSHCASRMHCNLHTNPKDGLGCTCTEDVTVGDEGLMFVGDLTRGA
jgi:hypothetical protein